MQRIFLIYHFVWSFCMFLHIVSRCVWVCKQKWCKRAIVWCVCCNGLQIGVTCKRATLFAQCRIETMIHRDVNKTIEHWAHLQTHKQSPIFDLNSLHLHPISNFTHTPNLLWFHVCAWFCSIVFILFHFQIVDFRLMCKYVKINGANSHRKSLICWSACIKSIYFVQIWGDFNSLVISFAIIWRDVSGKRRVCVCGWAHQLMPIDLDVL